MGFFPSCRLAVCLFLCFWVLSLLWPIPAAELRSLCCGTARSAKPASLSPADTEEPPVPQDLPPASRAAQQPPACCTRDTGGDHTKHQVGLCPRDRERAPINNTPRVPVPASPAWWQIPWCQQILGMDVYSLLLPFSVNIFTLACLSPRLSPWV